MDKTKTIGKRTSADIRRAWAELAQRRPSSGPREHFSPKRVPMHRVTMEMEYEFLCQRHGVTAERPFGNFRDPEGRLVESSDFHRWSWLRAASGHLPISE
ncbi:MAG TPA: hypothetical protein VHK88_13365 [Aquihabitans sp.]|jgi:hypothetical protein|nr:hypothetical protein [Aquihabitans sp.]